MQQIYHLAISALAVIITSVLLPGIELSGFFAAFFVALALGLVNTFIKPILVSLTLPLDFLPMGLLTFLINAFLIMLVGWIVPGFKVRNFWWALLFSLILSVVNHFLGIYL